MAFLTFSGLFLLSTAASLIWNCHSSFRHWKRLFESALQVSFWSCGCTVEVVCHFQSSGQCFIYVFIYSFGFFLSQERGAFSSDMSPQTLCQMTVHVM